MKEYPEPNYILKIWELLAQEEPEVARFLTGGWTLTLNHIADVTFLPYLPTHPWPPPPAVNLDMAHDRDEAARVVLSTSTQLVTPTDGEERIEELVGEIPKRQTIFWVTPAHYAALDAELRALFGLLHDPIDGDRFRLSDLTNSALRAFIQEDLPRSAALSDYERKILCLL